MLSVLRANQPPSKTNHVTLRTCKPQSSEYSLGENLPLQSRDQFNNEEYMLSGSRSKQEQIGYAGGFAQLSFTTTTTTNANRNLKNHITRLVSYFQYYYHVSYVSFYNST
jgi:hypothetical protein